MMKHCVLLDTVLMVGDGKIVIVTLTGEYPHCTVVVEGSLLKPFLHLAIMVMCTQTQTCN